MPFIFPDFQEPRAVDARRSWTAAFESYDQHHDDAWYAVTLHEDGSPAAAFTVPVALDWAGDDWTGPGFPARVRDDLHRIVMRRLEGAAEENGPART